MTPPTIGNTMIGGALNGLGGFGGNAMPNGMGTPNQYTASGMPVNGMIQGGNMGSGQQGQGNVQGVTPGQTPMNVQHPVAQLQQPKSPGGGAAPQGGNMQQALSGLKKIIGGQQPNPSQAQGQNSAPPVNKPAMPLTGNPQTPGADSAAGSAGMNPAATDPSSIAGSINPGDMTAGGAGYSGGLLGNTFDPSLQGGNFDPSSITDMSGGAADMSGGIGDMGGLLGLF